MYGYYLGDTQCNPGDVLVATSGSPICLSYPEAAQYTQQVGQMSPQDQAAYFSGPNPNQSPFGSLGLPATIGGISIGTIALIALAFFLLKGR